MNEHPCGRMTNPYTPQDAVFYHGCSGAGFDPDSLSFLEGEEVELEPLAAALA